MYESTPIGLEVVNREHKWDCVSTVRSQRGSSSGSLMRFSDFRSIIAKIGEFVNNPPLFTLFGEIQQNTAANEQTKKKKKDV